MKWYQDINILLKIAVFNACLIAFLQSVLIPMRLGFL